MRWRIDRNSTQFEGLTANYFAGDIPAALKSNLLGTFMVEYWFVGMNWLQHDRSFGGNDTGLETYQSI